jgi:predicted oxidoreductase
MNHHPDMPKVPIGHDGIETSALGLGCMGLAGTWNPSEFTAEHKRRGFQALEAALEVGITLFDHADIYGNQLCELVFGEFLSAHPGLRDRLFLTTKCGIVFADDQGGYRYNLSPEHIFASIDASLKRLQTDYLDLYQIHRPDPYTHPRETARALNQLVKDGRARMIGVSNHSPSQINALQAYLDVPIVTTQPSISLWNLEALDNGVLDQALELGIRPLAYSPLGGGILTGRVPAELASDPRILLLKEAFEDLGRNYGATQVQLSLAWLMHHPARIIPLLGSNNPANIREAAKAARIKLSREDWYKLWTAARGERLP